MPRHRIDIREYVNSHGSAPAGRTFGTWYLVRSDGIEITRTCYWRELVNMRFDYCWTLLP